MREMHVMRMYPFPKNKLAMFLLLANADTMWINHFFDLML